MEISKAVFVKSASKLEECPVSSLPEFAFIGRSNVGKSSCINLLANNSKLAKVSVVPGKTQLMNFFLVNDAWHLVDLPGYGYAKYGNKKRILWMDAMQEYLHMRKQLVEVFVLVDGSISLQMIDKEFIQTLHDEHIPFSLVITKIDKATQSQLHAYMKSLHKTLVDNGVIIPQIFQVSSTKKLGKEKLLEYIGQKLTNS